MTILIYSGKAEALGERLQEMIEDRLEHCGIESCIGIRQLTERVRRPLYDVAAAVLVASGKQDLEDLLSLTGILSFLPVIVILPDTDHDLVSRAHKLHPRFVATPFHRFWDVVLVLEKIVKRSERLRSEQGA